MAAQEEQAPLLVGAQLAQVDLAADELALEAIALAVLAAALDRPRCGGDRELLAGVALEVGLRRATGWASGMSMATAKSYHAAFLLAISTVHSILASSAVISLTTSPRSLKP